MGAGIYAIITSLIIVLDSYIEMSLKEGSEYGVLNQQYYIPTLHPSAT